MTIDKTVSDGRLTVRVCGRLDTNTSPELESALCFDGVSEIVFDFSALEYVSSAGLRVLMAAKKTMASVGGSVSVTGANEMVRGVLDMTGLSGVFNVS